MELSKIFEKLEVTSEKIERITPRYFSEQKRIEIFLAIATKINPDYKIDSYNKGVIINLLKYAHNEPFECVKGQGDLRKGIYLAGPKGTGKSMMMNILAQYLDLLNVLYKFQTERLFTYIRVGCNYVSDYYKEVGDTSFYVNQPLICFQDLGTEPKSTNSYGTSIGVMEKIIQDRGDRYGQVTHFTSNYLIDDLIYDSRIRSRLHGMCNQLILKGNDRRM